MKTETAHEVSRILNVDGGQDNLFNVARRLHSGKSTPSNVVACFKSCSPEQKAILAAAGTILAGRA